MLCVYFFLIITGFSFFIRQFSINSEQIFCISKNNSNWFIQFKTKMQFNMILSTVMNCTDGVEFDYS